MKNNLSNKLICLLLAVYMILTFSVSYYNWHMQCKDAYAGICIGLHKVIIDTGFAMIPFVILLIIAICIINLILVKKTENIKFIEKAKRQLIMWIALSIIIILIYLFGIFITSPANLGGL